MWITVVYPSLHVSGFTSPSSTFICHFAFVHPPRALNSQILVGHLCATKKNPLPDTSVKGNMLLSYSNSRTLSDTLMRHSCQTVSNSFLKHPKVWVFIPEQKSRLCESRYIEIQPQQSKQSNPGMSFLTQKVQWVRGSREEFSYW